MLNLHAYQAGRAISLAWKNSLALQGSGLVTPQTQSGRWALPSRGMALHKKSTTCEASERSFEELLIEESAKLLGSHLSSFARHTA